MSRNKAANRVVPVQHVARSNRRTHHAQLSLAVNAIKPAETVQTYKPADLVANDHAQVSQEKETVLDKCCIQGLGNASLGDLESTETELSEELEVLHLKERVNTNKTSNKLDNTPTNSLTLSGTDKPTHTLLTAAAGGDTRYLTELLTSEFVDVTDVNGRTALMQAAHAQHRDCIGLLLEAGTLCVCCYSWFIIRLLLGADVNLPAYDGSTVMHQVALSGAHSILPLLLHHKATKAALPDSQGRLPQHWAVYAPTTKCLDLLLDNDSSVDVTDLQGMTAAMWAAYLSQPDHLEQLVGRGASLSLRDNEGMSALHWSASGVGAVDNRVSCFKLLLSHESSW